MSPNSGSVDNDAGTGQREAAAESVLGKVKAKNIPEREERGGALGCVDSARLRPFQALAVMEGRAHCGAPCSR